MYSEGNGQWTEKSNGYPDFNSYVQNLHVFIFQTDGRTDIQTDGQTEGRTDRQTEKLIRCELGTYWFLQINNK
jgi:hypothetical protein